MAVLIQFLRDHWKGIIALTLLTRLVWSLKNNEYLKEHSKYLTWSVTGLVVGSLLVVVGFRFGLPANIGITVVLFGGVVTVLSVLFLRRITDRAVNDVLGGWIFDMLFSEGMFAERIKASQKLPNLTLLRHWRSEGLVGKAYWTARRSLLKEQRAYQLWLFAAETAALYRKDIRAAERIIRRLHGCPEFSNDQRNFAAQEFKGWAATQGVNISSIAFAERPSAQLKGSPLKEAAQLRNQGQYQKAKSRLELLLRDEPDNLAAGMLLMGIYAQNLERPDKAYKVLKTLENQPFSSVAFIDYARRSIENWTAIKAGSAKEGEAATKLVSALQPGDDWQSMSPLPRLKAISKLKRELQTITQDYPITTAAGRAQEELDRLAGRVSSTEHEVKNMIRACLDELIGESIRQATQENQAPVPISEMLARPIQPNSPANATAIQMRAVLPDEWAAAVDQAEKALPFRYQEHIKEQSRLQKDAEQQQAYHARQKASAEALMVEASKKMNEVKERWSAEQRKTKSGATGAIGSVGSTETKAPNA